MDFQKSFLVIGATLVIVVLFNLAIYALAKRRRGSVEEVEMIRQAMKTARHPWQSEQANLEALAKQVAELKEQPPNENTNHPAKNNNPG